jgi:Putative zinc-finger
MCDKELIIGYLYDELQSSEREAFGRHLASCATCRAELDGLRGTRAELASWAPPDPDLGFQIVRRAEPPARARTWRPAPAWWLAAAAVLLLAVSAAIANVEVSVGPDGLLVRTGWSRAPEQAAASSVPAVSPPFSMDELQQIASRVKTLEGQMAARPASAPVAAGMSDAELLRIVRTWLVQSEERQQSTLARQILQTSRDSEAARRTDFDRLLIALRQVQGTTVQTSQRQRALEDHVARVSLPLPR